MRSIGNLLRLAMLGALAIALGAGLGACGKKGDLDPPEGSKDRTQRTYPKTQ